MLALLCSAVRSADAQATARDTLPAVRAAAPPALDRFPGDPVWDPGRIVLRPGFIDLATRRAAPVATTVYLLYDDRNLYVAFHADQPAQPIAATQTTNGVGFGIDDFVGIGIDPGGAGSQVYYFETTPRGTRYQQASENARYAPLWSAAGRITGTSWDAVLIIPLASMRVHGGAQRWRLDFLRGIAATGEHLTWAYDGIMSDGAAGNGWPNYVDQRFWPFYNGFTLAAGGATRAPRADVYGLASVGHDRDLFEQADQNFAHEAARPLGIDFTAPLTSTVNFVGTLAPDFSNVEIDQQTITPQEFQRQLTEYRPFFAQGAAFLNPNPNPVGGAINPPNLIFYSPSIGPFDRGAKVEGTNGNDSFGVLSVRGYDPVLQEVFDDLAFGFAHALPDRTLTYWTDGVLAHHGASGSDETVEAGAKGRNLQNGFVWLLDTAVEQGTANGGVEHSTNGYLDVHKPNYEVNLGYVDVSPRYAPLDGYTTVSDIRGPTAFVNLAGNGSAVKNWGFFGYADRFFDDSGAVHEADTQLNLTAVFKDHFSINGIGPQTGLLRTYAVPAGPGCSGPIVGRSSYGGSPCYLDGITERYDLFTAAAGYGDGTPAPIDGSYFFGPFGGNMLHEFTLTTSRPLGAHYALALEYDGTWERAPSGSLDSQFLRRVGLERALGADSNVSLSFRSINGTGGFALPGTDVALAYHRHWTNGNDLYINFGTPAATSTLDRLIVKYVLHLGPLPGA